MSFFWNHQLTLADNKASQRSPKNKAPRLLQHDEVLSGMILHKEGTRLSRACNKNWMQEKCHN